MAKDLIQFMGLNDIDPVEQDMIKKLSEEYFGKIKRGLKNILTLTVHIKKSNKGGKQSHYTIKVMAEAPTHIFESTEEDWDLSRVTHKAFKSIEHQIEHKFKDSS
jgi:ribosome-associated translation inhibitor RaiA